MQADCIISFFSRFQPFLFTFLRYPSGSRPAFASRPALRSRQNHVFLFIFRCFLLISAVKSLKKVWNEQKRLKMAEKSISTSFWVPAAPKSWSKYTTFYWGFSVVVEKHRHFNWTRLEIGNNISILCCTIIITDGHLAWNNADNFTLEKVSNKMH